MQCRMRDKPFHVLTCIKAADLTLRNRASQLFDEYEVKWKEAWPTTDLNLKSEEQNSPYKTVAQVYNLERRGKTVDQRFHSNCQYSF